MRLRRHLRFVALLGTTLFCGVEATAAELPREGSFTNTSYAFGKWKGTAIGKIRFLGTFEEDGMIVGTGLTDHLTEHCFGMSDRMDDKRTYRAHCVLTDTDGDQIVSDNSSNGKYPKDARNVEASAIFTSGTGKYAGISGGFKYVCHGSEFKAPTDGTFFAYCTGEGNYKIP